ncbi:3-hydroxyacyl-CoA dehydrogenase NAD-binding domain-containing protein [Rhodospirillum sp. A1_3_36]|uniref:3-hydroxyacyl-CoA dehydrogenase NAD-binding domain-containing protein n=1 Tax=Rhodospirillum sp. A1_3_36 TaxID=3391666 RepID=UPI0039A76614
MVVTLTRDGDLMVVTVDNPPVNALSQALRQGLLDAVATVESDPKVRAAVLHCAGRTFIAGADIREFGSPSQPPHLPDVIAAIEGTGKPWVAAIHGSALGGGLEVALGCAGRVARAESRLGLPEVTLGVIPGAGGTVRLPRLIGMETATEMILSGKPIDAERARAKGLVDLVTEGDPLPSARTLARSLSETPPHPLSRRPCPDVEDGSGFWEGREATLNAKGAGQEAPLAALKALRSAATRPFDEAMGIARSAFLALRDSTQAKALRHVFLVERGAGSDPTLADIPPRPIESCGVVGGGTMGAGIVAALLEAGLPTRLLERDEATLAQGLNRVGRILDGAVTKGRLAPELAEARRALFSGTTDARDMADRDLVIEAVFEDLDVKRTVFRTLDKVLKADAIIATNTSYLDPREIATATTRPDRVIGLHFFSPAHVMKLLEVVPLPETAPDVLATALALGKRLRKIPVRTGICDGFIGNRILRILRREAESLLLEGATPSQVDAAMRAFGFPMGPFEAQDLGGLDIAHLDRRRLAASCAPAASWAPLGDALCDLGRLGQKTGGGWYDYRQGDRHPHPSPTVEELVAARRTATSDRTFSAEEIQNRIIPAMVNEGFHILAEGIARTPGDIDLVEIHGYGFPRWRGGLMYHADQMGLDRIRGALVNRADPSLAPSPLLDRLTKEGRTLADLNAPPAAAE